MQSHGKVGLLAAICAVLMLANISPARAADADAFVFGTSLVITSPKSLNPTNGYWGDLLPKAFNYSPGSIVDEINKARAARGLKNEIDVSTYPIVVGSETKKGGGFEYNIDFQHMTPDDVDVVLKKFPFTGKLAGLPHTVRPVSLGYYNGDSTDGGATVNLTVLDQALSFTPADGFNSIHDAVDKVVSARFGSRAKFDLSINYYHTVVPSSTSTFGVYVTIYLDGAEKNAPGGGEGGD